MAMNMNISQLRTLVEELYKAEGFSGVQELLVEMQTLFKEYSEIDKRNIVDQKMLDALKKAATKHGKALIKDLRKFEKFKNLKKRIAEDEKEAKKALAAAKKLAVAEKKALKPSKAEKNWHKLFGKQSSSVEKKAKKIASQLKSLVKLKKAAVAKAVHPDDLKVEKKQSKRWTKVLTKSIKSGEAETTKALKQLKKLVKLKKASDAKAKKASEPKKKRGPKKQKKAVSEAAIGDDLIATLLAKANPTQETPEEETPVEAMSDNFEVSDVSSQEQEEEEEIAVTRFEWDGVKYLKDGEGYLFDPETQEEIAFWNEETQQVEEIEC